MTAVMESLAGAGSKIDEINSRLESLERQLQGGTSGQGRSAATGGATGGSGGDGGAEVSAIAVVRMLSFVTCSHEMIDKSLCAKR